MLPECGGSMRYTFFFRDLLQEETISRMAVMRRDASVIMPLILPVPCQELGKTVQAILPP